MKTKLHALLIIAMLTSRLWGLDPKQPANSFLRTDFTLEDGLPSNIVNAIVQTQDDFLWIGTNAGLARFNGKRFTSIYFRGPESSPQGVVNVLALAPNGDLWVGTRTGIARLPKRALDVFDRSLATFYHLGSERSDDITCLRFSHDGSLWVGTGSGLFHMQGPKFRRILPEISVSRLEESVGGHILVTSGQGPFELDNGRMVGLAGLLKRLGVKPRDVFHVFDDHSGSRWICTNQGLFRKTGNVITSIGLHNTTSSPAFRIYEDRQSNLWVFTTTGLFRASSSGLELAMSQLHAATAYTDRDGMLWIGRKGDGLIRFKDRLIRMIKPHDVDQPLHGLVPTAVFSDLEGKVWVGSSCGGLSLLDGDAFKTYAEKDGLTNSCVNALAEDLHKNLWVGTSGGGLFKFSHQMFTQYSTPQGLADTFVKAIVSSPDGSIWIATNGGLSHMQDGKFRNYTTADGLSGDLVNNVFIDRLGGIWVATSQGVSRMSGDRFIAVKSTSSIYDKDHIGFGQDSFGSLYALAAPKGLSRIVDNRLVAVDTNIELLGMVEVGGKDLWFAGSNGIYRLPLDEVSGRSGERETPLDLDRFGRADGLSSPQSSYGVPNMTATPDGNLWVATTQGVAIIDLPRLHRTNRNTAPYVDEVTTDRITHPAGRELTVSPGVHHIALHFDSIELASPEKIRFQYRLDDVDPAWLDADASQLAVYTTVPIGPHSFRVRACNRDGTWDASGIAYSVTQRPFIYETQWFRLCAAASFVLLLLAAYRFRLMQIAHEYERLMDERVRERTRIARALHDTLLQSFHGLMLRFQAVKNMLPERPTQARDSLEIAISRAAKAITESREAIQKIRGQSLAGYDLVQALKTLDRELTASHAINEIGGTTTTFCVLVEGKPGHLHPAVSDDLYQIAREAVENAFRHAHANRIEVDIRYDVRMLRLRVRDDGIGIDPNLLRHGGLDGHWGLPGMRERANGVGGRLGMWSEINRGTEIEVTIPGSVAYVRTKTRTRFRDSDVERGGE